jgi:GNAT superfamily N-acetyltransferase
VDCIKSVYGEHSYYTRFYDADFVRSIEDRIFVAVFDGKVVGTTVLSDWGYKHRDFEISTLVVRKEMSGKNIARKLSGFALDKVSDLPSVKGAVVTSHEISQVLAKDFGYFASSILYGVFMNKSPLVLVVHNFHVKDVGRINVPEDLLPFAENLYSKLGASYEIAPFEPAGLIPHIPSNSDIWHEHDAHFQYLDIYVMTYGKDCKARIAEIERACAQPRLTVNIFIDMHDPLARIAYKSLMEDGCVYTGFMPLSSGSEFIILHKPLCTDMHPEEMNLISSMRTELSDIGIDLK